MMGNVNWITPEQQEAEALDVWRASTVVSRFQARAALREAGLRDQVETIIADPNTSPIIVDAWNDAQEFRRMSPTIQALAGELGLDDEAVDQLFKQAAQIEA
ncbi:MULTISPECIES: hypothetical protein [Halomonadaceae]|uniref:hypothetical protein n=1 Tax=Halomonadaceae TaxID=28256 RepID=UPI0015976639|nr:MULTISPECIES: hypothetical protein [Halomonas]QJQ93910.1 hypothetical protein HIO72_00440 [Halomonas sp. PA5]